MSPAPKGVSKAKFDRCVMKVKMNNPGRGNPFAICNVALRKTRRKG